MVTIDQLAQMCADVRSGTSSPTPDINPNSPLLAGLPSNWTVVATSAEPPFGSPDYWGHGYFSVAYRNTITG